MPKTKSSKSPLLSRRRFKKRDLIFIAALVSLVGVVSIISSFAAMQTTVEAETLKYGKVATIAGQTGGKAAAMYWTTTGTGTVQLPTKTTSVTIYAKGDQCAGAPQMVLSVNGQQVANHAVSSTTWKSYQVPLNLEAGNYGVSLSFTNDAGKTGAQACDRNLYVDRMVFTGLDKPATLSTTVQGEVMSATPSAVVGGSTAAEKARLFYANGKATSNVVLPNAVNQVKVMAKGDQCQGAPSLQLLIDGKVVATKAITNSNWGEHSFNLNIAAGARKVEAAFVNDLYIPALACDRNLYIDRIVLTGPAPAPKPPAPVPPVVTPKPTTPTTPAAQPVATYHPQAPYTIIMIGWRPYDKEYTQLANTKTNLVFRSIERTPNSQGKWTKLDQWDAAGYRYYNNVAGSDWASSGPGGACKNTSLSYMDQVYAQQLLDRKNNVGFYMHEMVSLYAACNGWNWTQAAQQMDWARVHTWMMMAKSQGKKVVWSEPAQGWNAITSNPTYQAVSPHWKDVLVPTFATNFRTPAYNHVPTARAGASNAARQLGSPLGSSVQSWYFREGYNDLSVDATVRLANYAKEAGTTYYQIEGTWSDMTWGSDYMKGILAFSKTLGPAGAPGSAAPVPVVQPGVKPQTAPVTSAKKPLYQLWNAAISDHMYTTNKAENDQLIAAKKYESQNIAGYVYEKQVAGSVPLYRLYSSSLTDHFYTNSENQRAQAKAGGGKYVDEGIVGYVMTSQVTGTLPFYQMYSAQYPDHYYTTQTWARDSAAASFRKYVDRGNAGYIFTKP